MNGRQALGLLQQNIQAVLEPLGVAPGQVGIGWPPETQIQDVALNKSVLVSVFDRVGALNSTRWPVEHTPPILTDPGVFPSLSLDSLTSLGSSVLTLSGTVIPNDAVALVVRYNNVQGAQVVVASPVDTAATLAASLADAVNGDPILSDWLSALNSGNTIALENTTPFNLKLSTGSANVGSVTYEVRRVTRRAQVLVWVATEQDRETYGNPIMTLLGQASSTYGFQDSDGNWVRVMYTGDMYVDEHQVKDIYRRDLYASLEYGETYTDFLYPILVEVIKIQPEQ